MRYFIPPDDSFFKTIEDPSFVAQNGKAYSYYNYLSGFGSGTKRQHFEIALRLTRKYFHASSVMDFGCADGIFLPSLAKYFNHVVAIDANSTQCKIASQLVRAHGLVNVEVICNDTIPLNALPEIVGAGACDVIYLLEVMEHVGDAVKMYDSKTLFLEKLIPLLSPSGVFVISVPVMTGLSFLMQRLALTILRKYKEPISWNDFFSAVLFKDTSRLEPRWEGEHLGFNADKLEKRLKEVFLLVEKQKLLFQQVWVFRPPQAGR